MRVDTVEILILVAAIVAVVAAVNAIVGVMVAARRQNDEE